MSLWCRRCRPTTDDVCLVMKMSLTLCRCAKCIHVMEAAKARGVEAKTSDVTLEDGDVMTQSITFTQRGNILNGCRACTAKHVKCVANGHPRYLRDTYGTGCILFLHTYQWLQASSVAVDIHALITGGACVSPAHGVLMMNVAQHVLNIPSCYSFKRTLELLRCLFS